MAVTLTPADVSAICLQDVTVGHIAAAAEICDNETGYTFIEHNESRGVPEALCQQAWAITATNVARWFAQAGDDPAITSESQGDYAYSVDQARRTRDTNDSPITPPVRQLLNIASAAWSHL